MADVLRIREVTVRRYGGRILLLNGGRLLLDLPWRGALDLGAALIQQARKDEEIANHEQVVRDQAILNRAGIRLGLVNDPHLQEEAMKEAAWNSDLRRYMPGGIKSQEIVGTPTLIGHPPKPKEDHDGKG